MKKYQRATGNELDTFLLRNSKVKNQPELFNEVRDIDGNIIDPDKIKRANEMTGAGIEYATSLVEYICTHHKDLIRQTQSALYYETIPIEWSAALDIMTGGIPGQRDRATRAILNLHASPKPVLIKRKDGHLISMQPFVLAFDWGRKETLDARAAAKLARLQKGVEKTAKKRAIIKAQKENRALDENEIIYPDLLPIETISIQFSKPLFEDLFIKRGNTYSFPTGMYAQMFYYANAIQEAVNELKDKNDESAREFVDRFSGVSNEPYISAFARFARYIVRHNNLTTKQLKDKNYHGPMNIVLLDMVSEVYPSAISKNGRGEHHVEMKKIKKFLDMALILYYFINDFLFYPVIKEIKSETLAIELYTDANKAEKEIGANTKKGNFIRRVLSLPDVAQV